MKPHIKYRSGYKHQLADDYTVETGICPPVAVRSDFIDLDANGLMSFRSDYAWDGPSGPVFATKSSMRGSLVHDGLYQLIRMELLPAYIRAEADDLMRRLFLEDKMFKVRAWAWWKIVKRMAKRAASPKAVKKVRIAP